MHASFLLYEHDPEVTVHPCHSSSDMSPSCPRGIQHEGSWSCRVNLTIWLIISRSRLASASIPVVHSGGREDVGRRRDVISLLCSIFLANRGSGEAAGEEKPLSYVSKYHDLLCSLQRRSCRLKMLLQINV